VALKPNLIWIIQRYRHIENHSRINNLASNINAYHSTNTMWSKWGFAMMVLVLGFLVVLLDLKGKELFFTFWYWEKGFKTLIKPFEKLWSVYTWKYEWFLNNECHSHRWLSYPFSKPRRSNSNVIILRDHLELIEGMHTFCLDQTLLNLKVCNFTLICQNGIKN